MLWFSGVFGVSSSSQNPGDDGSHKVNLWVALAMGVLLDWIMDHGQEVAVSGPGVSVVHMPRDAHRTTWLCLNAQHRWFSKRVPLPGEGAYTENLLTMPFVGPHPWPTETLGLESRTCMFISPPGDSDACFCLRINGVDKRSTNTFL